MGRSERAEYDVTGYLVDVRTGPRNSRTGETDPSRRGVWAYPTTEGRSSDWSRVHGSLLGDRQGTTTGEGKREVRDTYGTGRR